MGEMAECTSTEDPDQPKCQNATDLGMTNASTIPFFNYAFTFFNESATVTCCHQNTTAELATCGMGTSCEGSCSAIKASLCPSGDCAGDCELPFELESNLNEGKLSISSIPPWQLNWCTNSCNVWTYPVCCFNPVCYEARKKTCWRLLFWHSNHPLFGSGSLWDKPEPYLKATKTNGVP